jgi:Holliday junction resolvase
LTPLGWVSAAWKLVGLTASAWNFGEAFATGDVASMLRSVATAVVVYFAGQGACGLPTAVQSGARSLMVLGAVGNVQSAIAKFNDGDPIAAILDLGQTVADLFGAFKACFTGRMLIDEASGKKYARDIRQGDWLWARDERNANGPVELRQVEEVFVRVSPVLNLDLAGQIIETTPEHPFFVEGKGWVQAGFLRTGDLLRTRNGLWIPVGGVVDSGQVQTVYNWAINEYHTYFVSATEGSPSIWAHNAACGATGTTAERAARKALIKRGHQIVGSIQNGSGHGVDLISRKGKKLFFWEVKGSEVGRFRLSSDQSKGASFFVNNRLTKAISPTTGWKSVDPHVWVQAQNLLNQGVKNTKGSG